jgi:hypothetical protein
VPQPGRRVHSVEARGLAPLFGGNEEELAEEELAAWEKRMKEGDERRKICRRGPKRGGVYENWSWQRLDG